MKRILIVGGVYDKHAYRFISHLKKEDCSLKIDLLSYEKRDTLPECANFCEETYFPEENMRLLYDIKMLGSIAKTIDFKRTLQTLATRGIVYDAILVLWVFPRNALSANAYRQLSKHVVLVPLGSDVLRISKITALTLKPFYKKASHVVLHPETFKQKAMALFSIQESKIVALDFGSSQIDKLLNNDTSKAEAQKALGFTDKFVITVGYNAVKEQNHMEVLEQITQVRSQLPQNLLIVLPMTYPISPTLKEYIQSIRKYLQRNQYNYRIFDSYLSDEELLYLRKCSDIFIHAQTTDASCATVQEYLLSGCTVLNGKWLHYPELEAYGMPYYTFDTPSRIGSCLAEAVNHLDKYHPASRLKEQIARKGWNYQIKLWVSFLNSLR